MNPYLQKTKFAQARQQDEYGFLGIGEAWDTAKKYWTDKGVVEGLTSAGSEILDYSSTQKEARNRNKERWKFILEIAKKYRDAGPWPANVERKLLWVNKAYPDLPSSSNVLAIAPNSIAAVNAQAAMFAYITAKMFDKPEFIALGDVYAKKAKNSDKSVLQQGSVKARQKEQKVFLKDWMKTAVQTGIITNWYNLIQQFQNAISGEGVQAERILERLKLMTKRNELEFADQLTKDSSSSVFDLLYVMRGWLGMAGVVLMIVYGAALFAILAAYVPGFASAAGRVATTAGRGVAKGAKGAGKLIGTGVSRTGKALSGLARNSMMNAISDAKEALNDKDFQKSVQNIMNGIQSSGANVSPMLQTQLNQAMANPNLNEEDLKRIIKQVLTETGA
jgi:hypothetical protein